VKAMFSAFAAALIIAYGSTVVLEQFGWSSAERGSSPTSVRLD